LDVLFQNESITMPKTRLEKEQIIAELTQKVGRLQSAVFTQVSGYTMEDADSLRKKGAAQNIELFVAKKTLLTKALEANGYQVSKDDFDGSILTSLAYGDDIAAAKLMAEFAKGRDGIKIVAGILEGRFVKQLATLPSREELLAKLVGSLNAPVSGFVNVLAGNLRGLVRVLDAIKETKA